MFEPFDREAQSVSDFLNHKKWTFVSLFLTVFFLPPLLYSGFMLSKFGPQCTMYNCQGNLTKTSSTSECLIKVIETDQIFTQVCCRNDNCEHLVCLKHGICYVNGDQISFRGCSIKKNLIWIFILTIFGELLFFPLLVFSLTQKESEVDKAVENIPKEFMG